ncbi:MAG: hydroxymethylbilane synthase [Vicinamibacterales bacterium]
MTSRHLRLGTRGSQLALFQANAVAALLRLQEGITCDIIVIRTSGDRLAEATLSEVGGKRLFVKEIEDALLAGDIDLAVHSSKDMPAALPDRLDVCAVLPREDARDALVLPLRSGADLVGSADVATLSLEEVVASLGPAPRIGTSSVRRSAQLVRLFPGASFLPIRGNLDTRLRKVDGGDFDAIVLAAAGLRRLQQAHRISAALPVDACVPAPGQGIIAIEIRSGDIDVRSVIVQIDDRVSRLAFDAEREVVTRLGGGCQMPIGAFATVADEEISVTAIVVSLDGARAIRADVRGGVANPRDVGARAARQLLDQGAGDILAGAVERPGAQAQSPAERLQP